MGGPRPMGPSGPGGARPPSRTNMLQERAEQRRRDDEAIAEMRVLLGQYSGAEIDDDYMERFSQGMQEEAGALPPPHVVVAAIKLSESAEPQMIADAVRTLNRRRPPVRPVQPPAASPEPVPVG